MTKWTQWVFFFFVFLSSSICNANPAAATTKPFPIELTAFPWYLNADGRWITHVIVKNSSQDVRLSSTQGEVYNVPKWYNNRSTITIRLTQITSTLPIVVTARSSNDHHVMGKLVLPSPAIQYSDLQFRVQAIGPYLVNMAWYNFDKQHPITQFRIFRKDVAQGTETLLTTLDAQHNAFHDDTVKPNRQYLYRILADTSSGPAFTVEKKITTPESMKSFPISTMQGIGATLFFTTDPSSKIYYKKMSPELLFKQVKLLNLKYIQLRTVYGSYAHTVTPEQMAWIDQILDAAHDQGIAVFSWCIPQRDTSSALATDVAMAAHVSPKGNTFAGISVDLEIEKDYMQNIPNKTAQEAIADFVKFIRKAVGPDYLFSAIIYSPVQVSGNSFPFRTIGQYASIVQPMEFWHYHLASKKHVYTQKEVSTSIVNTIKLTRQLVGPNIPINIIGQITDVDDDMLLTGIPSAEEVTAALQAAKENGALGVSFYNWNDKLFLNGELSPQAKVLKNFVW